MAEGPVANWQVIERASQTIRRIVQNHVDAQWPGSNVKVHLATPHVFLDLKATQEAIISIFLYRVLENPELRNSPMRRTPNGFQRQPMVLELCYLITPWGARGNDPSSTDAKAALEEHKMLGLILQALYDKAELSRSELYDDPAHPAPVWGPNDSIQVVHDVLPIEDLYRIWDSSELAYQLSATYRVRVLGLDSTESRLGPPVVEGTFGLESSTAVEGG